MIKRIKLLHDQENTVKNEMQKTKDEVPKVSENFKNQTTSKYLNMNSVFTITNSNEINSTFCLQTVDEFIIFNSKHEIHLMKFDCNSLRTQSKMQFSSSSFKVSNYNVVESFNVDFKKIFQKSSHQDKSDIMLSSDLFPHCIQYHAQVFKCLLSPYNRFDENNKEPVIASLNSHGSLELLNLKYDEDSKKYILASSEELCKLRMDSLTLNNEIKSLNGLNEVVRDFTFTYFDWCPEIMNGTRFLAALDKNSNINLFNIQNGKVNFLFDVKMNARITYIKWIIVKTQHYLITSCSKGGLIISTVEIENDKILKCEVHRNIPGKLRISISNVQHVYSHEKFILLCIKAHSIEMFFLDDFEETSITKYIGLSVTGICEIGKFEYLITTLDNKAFYMKINVENDKIIIEKYLEVKQTSNSEVHSSSFGIYGLAASNNKVLFFTALYPRIAYDHLVLKQPLVLSVNTLSNRSPQEMLIINKSRNLSRFYDCIEAVRFVGGLKLDYLSMLENRDYEIALNDEFLYYLKLQLIVVRSKLWYYQTRSSIIYSIIIDTERSIKKIIDVLRAFHLLNSLLSKKKISSEETKLSMQCLINFIDIYLKEEIKKEPFKAAQETFRNDLENLQQKCNSLKLSKLVESCLYCSQPILENQLTCTSNHILNRCAITKLQIPFEMNNICLACDCVVIEKSTIDKVTGSSEQISCSYCDQIIIFK